MTERYIQQKKLLELP